MIDPLTQENLLYSQHDLSQFTIHPTTNVIYVDD